MPTSISGIKYHDLNANGNQDAGEPGLSGWEIKLFDADGNEVQTTLTDENGNYEFTGIDPGAYSIAETQRPGWVQTEPVVAGDTGTFVPNCRRRIYPDEF